MKEKRQFKTGSSLDFLEKPEINETTSRTLLYQDHS